MTASTPDATPTGPDRGPETTATLMIRVWVGEDQPRPRARLIDVRADGAGAEEAMTDPVPISAAVARWLPQ